MQMSIALKPELQKFIEEQITQGRFHSLDEAFEEAVIRMMRDEQVELDDETVAAINRAEAQLEGGEGLDFDQFAAQTREKYGIT